MTIAELNRFFESYVRREKIRMQEIATNNYILANLIRFAVGSCLSSEVQMPRIEEVYSSLFEEKAEETQQKKQELTTDLSVLRFKQFADTHNKKFKGGGN